MTLPKSVKIRSTCNACQQAKIRCSHEKPSCRRCQKHNIDCVYSISRRLGRPAKKRDSDQKKRKPKKELMNDTHEIDFNADSWLQDFITDVPETSSSFLDSGSSNSSSRSNGHSPLEPISPSMLSVPTSTIPDCADPSLPSSSYYDQSLFQASPETFDMGLLPIDMDTSTSPADTVPSISTPVSPQQLPPPGNSTNTTLDIHPQPQPSLRPFEYEYPFPDSTGIHLETYTPTPQTLAPPVPPTPTAPGDPIGIPTCHCHCHEKILHEVIRLNMMLCATSRISSPPMTRPAAGMNVGVGISAGGLGTGTLDMILNIQCGLQNLSEAVLQCTLCAENRATLLTVVMVNIDTLVGVIDRVAAVLVLSSSSESSVSTAMGGGHRAGAAAGAIKGGFQTPVEEKYVFVRQVFLGKLGGLLAVIRRIRFCMQEMLVGSSSRAQFVMMMETDRRLQMVIMRMRMGR